MTMIYKVVLWGGSSATVTDSQTNLSSTVLYCPQGFSNSLQNSTLSIPSCPALTVVRTYELSDAQFLFALSRTHKLRLYHPCAAVTVGE